MAAIPRVRVAQLSDHCAKFIGNRGRSNMIAEFVQGRIEGISNIWKNLPVLTKIIAWWTKAWIKMFKPQMGDSQMGAKENDHTA